jgi:hypothetical protein
MYVVSATADAAAALVHVSMLQVYYAAAGVSRVYALICALKILPPLAYTPRRQRLAAAASTAPYYITTALQRYSASALQHKLFLY